MLLGIDIGTTNTKAGLFDSRGATVAIASRPTVTLHSSEGYSYYDPKQLWETVAAVIAEAAASANAERVTAIGISSMAESGLLLDRTSGEPRSIFMPWFDMCSSRQAKHISAESDAGERFRASGLHNSYKLGLAKLLWLKERDPQSLDNAVWLSASGYIAYKLSGRMAFDYTLAARTYAFDLDRREWDEPWLRHFGVDPAIFPEALPSGTVIGHVCSDLGARLGISEAAVAIAGHDHVSAALAAGAIVPGVVYDSMGTAETMVGTLADKPLGAAEYASGLSFGLHIAEGRRFWMGGNSASGGSVEWLRSLLADELLTYERLLQLLADTAAGPSGILYYPYLSGSGAPTPDPSAKAAWIGLTKSHNKGDLIKAVLEGTAYQLEAIRRTAEQVAGQPIRKLLVVGGGTRNPHWLQIKADVTNCELELPPIAEATLLGSALAAGIGSGLYRSAEEAVAAVRTESLRRVAPDAERHGQYNRLYEGGYAALQAPLRQFYRGQGS